MTPEMVAALERQYTTKETRDGDTQHRWRLVAEGLVVDLAAITAHTGRMLLGVWVQWMGAHARRPFTLDGEDSAPISHCESVGAAGWCVVDASRGKRLIRAWEKDRDDAPIWAALEALAAEVEW